MFDIAYESEVHIFISSVLKEQFYEEIKKLDLSIPFNGIDLMFLFERMSNINEYWSIMFFTHGT